MDLERNDVPAITATITAAYLRGNRVPTGKVCNLVESIAETVRRLRDGEPVAGRHGAVNTGRPMPEPATSTLGQRPAVDPKLSVFAGHLVCLECGGKFSVLRRHLGAAHAMTADQYRTKWNLTAKYPMLAPDSTEKHRAGALKRWRGQRGKRTK